MKVQIIREDVVKSNEARSKENCALSENCPFTESLKRMTGKRVFAGVSTATICENEEERKNYIIPPKGCEFVKRYDRCVTVEERERFLWKFNPVEFELIPY